MKQLTHARAHTYCLPARREGKTKPTPYASHGVEPTDASTHAHACLLHTYMHAHARASLPPLPADSIQPSPYLGREAVGGEGEGARGGGAGDDDGFVGVEGALRGRGKMKTVGIKRRRRGGSCITSIRLGMHACIHTERETHIHPPLIATRTHTSATTPPSTHPTPTRVPCSPGRRARAAARRRAPAGSSRAPSCARCPGAPGPIMNEREGYGGCVCTPPSFLLVCPHR